MTNSFSKHAVSFPTALSASNPPKQRHTPMRWDWTLLPSECVELILKFAEEGTVKDWDFHYQDVCHGWDGTNFQFHTDPNWIDPRQSIVEQIHVDVRPVLWDREFLRCSKDWWAQEFEDLGQQGVCLIVDARQYLEGPHLVGRVWDGEGLGAVVDTDDPDAFCFKFALADEDADEEEEFAELYHALEWFQPTLEDVIDSAQGLGIDLCDDREL